MRKVLVAGKFAVVAIPASLYVGEMAAACFHPSAPDELGDVRAPTMPAIPTATTATAVTSSVGTTMTMSFGTLCLAARIPDQITEVQYDPTPVPALLCSEGAPQPTKNAESHLIARIDAKAEEAGVARLDIHWTRV